MSETIQDIKERVRARKDVKKIFLKNVLSTEEVAQKQKQEFQILKQKYGLSDVVPLTIEEQTILQNGTTIPKALKDKLKQNYNTIKNNDRLMNTPVVRNLPKLSLKEKIKQRKPNLIHLGVLPQHVVIKALNEQRENDINIIQENALLIERGLCLKCKARKSQENTIYCTVCDPSVKHAKQPEKEPSVEVDTTNDVEVVETPVEKPKRGKKKKKGEQ